MINPTSASFLISEDCNLACKYCFELKNRNKKHMSKEIAKEAVSFLYRNAINSEDEKEVAVTLFGGEPFLNFDAIDTVIETGVELREKTQIPFVIGAITNGTIMNEKILKKFHSYKEKYDVEIGIQLSVDGVESVHDENRVTKSGKGSFKSIEANIPMFKEIFGGQENYINNKRHMLHVHGVVTKKSLPHLYEGYKFFKEEWGIPTQWYMPIEDPTWSKENAGQYYEQLKLIKDDIVDQVEKTGDLIYLHDYAPLNRSLQEEQKFFTHPCSIGRTYCSVTASGDVYPCHQVYFNEPLSKTVDIWNGIDHMRNRFFEDYSPDDIYCTIDKECTNYNCYRCIAENYCQTGSCLTTKYSARCKMSMIERYMISELRKFVSEFNNRQSLNPSLKSERLYNDGGDL